VGWGAVGVSDRFADARACGVGDVMVDGSIRRERLPPLGLLWAAASGREPRAMREPAGRVRTHRGVDGLGAGDWVGLHRSVGDRCERGRSRARAGYGSRAGELAGDGKRDAGVGVVRAVLPERVREMPRTRRGGLRQSAACARASLSPGTTNESTSVANLRMCLRFPRASIVFVLDFSLRRSGRDTARAEVRTCRCQSSVRRSTGSGSHTGPPGRSEADGHPC
jgi:hypothetical protein